MCSTVMLTSMYTNVSRVSNLGHRVPLVTQECFDALIFGLVGVIELRVLELSIKFHTLIPCGVVFEFLVNKT